MQINFDLATVVVLVSSFAAIVATSIGYKMYQACKTEDAKMATVLATICVVLWCSIFVFINLNYATCIAVHRMYDSRGLELSPGGRITKTVDQRDSQ